MAKNSTISLPASGDIGFPMTNDYLFRALLQMNNRVLKGLIASLLHMDEQEIFSAIIQNPIELGESFDDKEFILDVKVLLNNNKIINLEMQVINRHDWAERSLSYLCRSFDNLEAGANYKHVTAVHQIGILNFTLFEEYPEFFATYEFLNVKNHHPYSSKLRLSVLDLTHIDLATDEDRLYKIDYWAELFRSTTWEDLNMLAQKDENIKEAAEVVYEISQERLIRDKIRAREDYYRSERANERYYNEKITALQTENDGLKSEISELSAEINELKKRLVELEAGSVDTADRNG